MWPLARVIPFSISSVQKTLGAMDAQVAMANLTLSSDEPIHRE